MTETIALLPRKLIHVVVPQSVHLLLLHGIISPLEMIVTVINAVVVSLKAGAAVAALILVRVVLLHGTVIVGLLVDMMIVHRTAVTNIPAATLEVIMPVVLLEGMTIAILVAGMGTPETTGAAAGMMKDQSVVVAKTVTETTNPKSALGHQMRREPPLRLPPPLHAVLGEDGGLT